MQKPKRSLGVSARLAIAGSMLLLAVVAGVSLANAAGVEIIPAAGLTRPVDSDDNTSNAFGSLSLRGQIVPLLAAEIGVAYRQESRFDDNLKVRMWPVTTSLWVTPIPALYAGGGVGWYNMSFDYNDALVPPLENETVQDFGVHLGGGVRVPLASAAALDLNGRYVMLREQDDRLVPNHFDPDFWQMALGLAIKF
jgi:hypothetical protein